MLDRAIMTEEDKENVAEEDKENVAEEDKENVTEKDEDNIEEDKENVTKEDEDNITEEDMIVIVPLRDLSYEDAKKEIIKYLENAGKRTVYTSEIVEELRLDIELTAKVLHEWRDQMCKNHSMDIHHINAQLLIVDSIII